VTDATVSDESLDKGLAAEVDYTRELRHAAGSHHEVGDARAHVDESERLGALGAAALVDERHHGRYGAREGEGLKIDAVH